MATRTKKRPTREAPPPAPLPGAVDALLSLRDVARALSIGYSTAKQMRAAGELPPDDLPMGGRPRWKCSTINKWIEERCHAGRPQTP